MIGREVLVLVVREFEMDWEGIYRVVWGVWLDKIKQIFHEEKMRRIFKSEG